jgi:hypothetical protein
MLVAIAKLGLVGVAKEVWVGSYAQNLPYFSGHLQTCIFNIGF